MKLNHKKLMLYKLRQTHEEHFLSLCVAGWNERFTCRKGFECVGRPATEQGVSNNNKCVNLQIKLTAKKNG